MLNNVSNENFPFIDNIEELILPTFLQDRKSWITFKDHLDPSFFKQEEYSTLFKIFKLYFDKYKTFPTQRIVFDIIHRKNFSDSLKKYVENVYNSKKLELSEINYIFDECAKFIKNNKIKNAILSSIEPLEKEDYNVIEKSIKDAVNWNHNIDLGTKISDVHKRFEDLNKLVDGVIPSPWKALNSFIGGGFYAKELTIFAASSSVGKSIALDNIALYSWMKGFNVVLITLELSETRKGQRIDAAATQTKIQDIIYREDEVVKFYKQFDKRKNGLWIKEFPTSSVSTKEIERYLHNLYIYDGLEKPDILIVDYLDILLPNIKRVGSTYIDQGVVGENLRAIGQELYIPVVTASQFNRGNIGITIDDLTEGFLADSFKKMFSADCLIGMVASPEDRINNRINLKALKNRNGPKDVIFPLNIYYEQLRMSDINKK